MDLQDPSEIERAIVEFSRGPNGGLIVTPNGLAIVHRELIINLAAVHEAYPPFIPSASSPKVAVCWPTGRMWPISI